jgi:hypothetical protein
MLEPSPWLRVIGACTALWCGGHGMLVRGPFLVGAGVVRHGHADENGNGAGVQPRNGRERDIAMQRSPM